MNFIPESAKMLTISGQVVGVLRKNETIKDVAQGVANNRDAQGIDKPFFVVDCGRLKDLWDEWHENLPRVHPYYAIKANDDQALLQCLSWLGTNFDCASPNEINKVLASTTPERIIYANPYKTKSNLKFAQEKQVTFTTFDCFEELEKIKEFMPNAKLLLRIFCPDTSAKLSPLDENRFGCDAEEMAPKLLKHAAEMNIDVAGICFHIGSGCRNSAIFGIAIEKSAKLIKIGQSMGLNMKILDIGGGFPGFTNTEITFKEVADIVMEACKKHSEMLNDVQLIAEPGRYFCQSVCSLCCNVVAHAKLRPPQDDAICHKYVLNDGIYNSFLLCYQEKDFYPTIEPLFDDETEQEELWSVVYGPTCSTLDKIRDKIKLPLLQSGQWVISNNMGAYSMTVPSEFNGFSKPDVFYFISEDNCKKMKDLHIL